MAKKKQRANGAGTVYPLKNGKFQACIDLGIGPNGKRLRKTRTRNSRADANAVLIVMQSERVQGILVNPSRSTVGEILTKWIDEVIKGERASNTEESYKLAIKNHIRPHIGQIKIADLKASHIESLLSLLKEAKVGDRTRQNVFTVLNMVMKKAKRWGFIAVNPCEGVDKPQYRAKRMNPFTVEESKLILDTERDSKDFPIWCLALQCGMRQGEIFGLSWSNVDIKGKQVTINQQLTEVNGKLSVERPKTETSIRTIEITDLCADALHRHRKQMLRTGNGGKKLLFLNSEGGMIRKSSFRRWVWVPLLARLKLDYRGFHNLRHSFASIALGAGIPLHVVSRIMGHASPEITLRTYAHMMKGQQSEAKEAMARLLG